MFFVLSKILDLVFEPLVWALLCFLLAIPWTRRRARRWTRRRAFGLAGIVVLYAMSTDVVAQLLLGRLEEALPDTYDPEATYDAVILLGGVTDERIEARTGQPTLNDNAERVVMTHRLLAEGHARVAILSGGAMEAAFAEHGEARSLAKQLAAWGITEDALVLEEKSRNTRENAVYSAEIVRARGYRRVLVVTSAFHMLRAAECFVAVDLPVDTLRVDHRAHAPSSILPRAGNLQITTGVLREIFGRVVYRLQGYAKAR